MRPYIARTLFAACSALAFHSAIECARGQQAPLPEITVTPPKEKPKTTPAPKQKAKAAPLAKAQPATQAAESGIAAQTKQFNTARENLLPNIGTNTYPISAADIEARPQGSNASLDKVLLQAPGVTLDSAASGNLHVRNEHANLQYRINGIIIPDGVSGFGQLLETSFIRSVSLVTGALPAQYGLRTTGLVDIQTKSGALEPGGSISIYGGNRRTLTPSIEYGGASGPTEYFFTGRGFFTDLGLENPAPTINAIHDQTQQGRAFGYASRLLDDTTRLTSIVGISVQKYQIPDRTGLPPQFTAFGVSDFDSAKLDERQLEKNFYSVLAVQKKLTDADLQIAYFSRYSSIHFQPDPIGDVVFNGVASDVFRGSFLNGVQADAAYRLNPAHTLRSGFVVSGEQTKLTNADTLLPVDQGTGLPFDAPFAVVDANSKLGWLLGYYIQDEWKITNRLTLNAGIRFDQMYQFVDANQFSPRASLTYKPVDGTTLHFGYARYFTPPQQVIAAPTNLALFDGTTQEPPSCPPPHPVTCASPVQPERSHYFDAGVSQKVLPGIVVGADVYYKVARNLLDDGQFGAAYVLSGFNYDRAFNKGIELTAKYQVANFSAYANLAWAQQMGTNIVSNQFLADPVELAYIANHYIYTDHAQTWTGSAGVSYLWDGTRFSADMIYGSGLRNGFANTDHLPLYTQVNAGISREFTWFDDKPTKVRFDVINVFDSIHEIRDGSGIGVFAPQFGPRRAYYLGLSQKFGPNPDRVRQQYSEPVHQVSCCFTWTGFYFGLNAGEAWTDSHAITFTGADTGTGGLGSEIADGTTPAQAKLDWGKSFTGGAQAGYNLQISGIVVGLETDLQWLNGHAEFSVDSANPLRSTITTSAAREMNMLATIRGRIGVVLWERSLLYFTGGLAVGDATLRIASACPDCATPRDVTSSSAGTSIGWAIGGGYEAALSQRVSLKAEYLHYDLGQNHTTITYDYAGDTSSMTGKVRDDGNIVRLGINFKLDRPVDMLK